MSTIINGPDVILTLHNIDYTLPYLSLIIERNSVVFFVTGQEVSRFIKCPVVKKSTCTKKTPVAVLKNQSDIITRFIEII